MLPESIAIVSVAAAATFVGAGGDPSIIAIPGAMLSAMVAVLKATQEKRTWPDRAIVVIGTSVVGSTAPSAMIHWFWPEVMTKMIWQTWAMLGFVCGLVGWSLAYAFVKVLGLRSEGFVDRWVRKQEKRFIGDDESKGGRGKS